MVLLSSCSSGSSSPREPVRTNPEHSAASPVIPTNTSLLRYVSPTGNDQAPGTRERPWKTLAFAFTRLYAGQVLFVTGGEYHEQIERLSLHDGTPSEPITVLPLPGETAVIHGSISLSRPNYWLIDGLDVTSDAQVPNPPQFMVKITGGIGWTWQNSTFWGSRGSANVFITGSGATEPSGWNFVHNCLYGLRPAGQPASNLVIGPMRHAGRGFIARNVIFNLDGQQNVSIGSAAGGPARVRLRYNTIYGGDLAIGVAGSPRRIKITHNLIGGATASALVRFSEGVPDGTTASQNLAVTADQLFRPEVTKLIKGVGNVLTDQDPDFADVETCAGYRPGLDAAIPYGAFAP